MSEEAPESDAEEVRAYPGLVTLTVAFDTVREALNFQSSLAWQVESGLDGVNAKLVEFNVKALDDTDQEELL